MLNLFRLRKELKALRRLRARVETPHIEAVLYAARHSGTEAQADAVVHYLVGDRRWQR